MKTTLRATAFLALIWCGVAATGCGNGAACNKDTDCASGRVCQMGACVNATAEKDASCAKQDRSSCLSCCDANHPGGLTALSNHFKDCLCQLCASTCTDICNGSTTQLSNACNGCQMNQNCTAIGDLACEGDTACYAFDSCIDACPAQ